MTVAGMAALFGAMAVLAAVPSVSVLAVTSRSASHGFGHGAATSLGIVAGDLVFVLLAVFGLALLVEALGETFFLVRYLAGALLIWLGVSLWRAPVRPEDGDAPEASLLSSFMAGLLLTLADQKAVLFYLGLLPAFVDLAAISLMDVAAVAAVTIVAVGGVKLGYAYAADRAGAVLGKSAGRVMNRLAACVMMAVGFFLIVFGDGRG